jgi:cysteine synthase A
MPVEDLSQRRARGIVPPALRELRHLIGRTPLLELQCHYRGKRHRIYAKYEIANLTGSIKDRMALTILEAAYCDGSIRPGDEIAEATSGNTGISFAAIGRALGHRVRIYMPDWMSRERGLLMQGFGAEVQPVSSEQGGFLGSIRLADEYARDHERVFRPRQFDSDENVRAHCESTAPELLQQLAGIGRAPVAFVAGVGTGGTVMGVARCFRQRGIAAAVHPLEPANSPTLRTGCKVGSHRIQGISDEFIPAIVQLDSLAPVVDVWDGDAICMARRVASELGIAVGISSGANFLGALLVAERLGEDSCVATVFCDDNKKYLSTDLCRAEQCRDNYLSGQVRLDGLRVIPCGC